MEKHKILLVEDDQNLSILLKEYLEIKNFDVFVSNNGEEGFDVFSKNKFDLCILDVMMPKKDGFSLAKDIRKIDSDIPIIFLTAKSLIQDKIDGLKIGGDDYITKPFSTEELLLRIKAILKRVSNQKKQKSTEEKIFKLGKYEFEYPKRQLKIEKQKFNLTGKEAELLRLLCINKNETLNRSDALKIIWKEDSYFTSRSMDVYITKLRNYLKEDKNIEIINVHGTGFTLKT
ncbi:MAG: response regulator transcription factor [Ignavibacteriales bacterium]|nr:response regulator transcription factor [Ignavibacteriales bacterium]